MSLIVGTPRSDPIDFQVNAHYVLPQKLCPIATAFARSLSILRNRQIHLVILSEAILKLMKVTLLGSAPLTAGEQLQLRQLIHPSLRCSAALP